MFIGIIIIIVGPSQGVDAMIHLGGPVRMIKGLQL